MKDVASEVNKILKSYLEGNKKSAYLKLKKISKAYPGNEKLKFNLAFMEQDQGDLNSAKKSYIKLIDEFNNFNSKLNLYNIFLKEENYYKSLELINDILNTNKDLVDVWIDKAYINYKIKEYNLSKDICHLILKKQKNNAQALNLIGLCFFKEKRYEDSIHFLLEGLKTNNKDISILNSLGEIYYELRNLVESEKYYLKALEINPDSHRSLNNLAGFYLETNNSEKALNFYNKALRIFPDEPKILNNTARAYFSLNDSATAKKLTEKALAIRSSASAKKMLSYIYFKEKQFTKAWKYFDGRLEDDNFIDTNNSYNLVKDKLVHQKKINPKKELLIIKEQGVGDEILYGSMYKNILENFENAYIETDERLINLFVNSFGKSFSKNFIKFGHFSKDEIKLKKIDQVLYSGSLGYYFRNKINDFPKKGYLKVEKDQLVKIKERLLVYKKKFKVGISWKSFNNPYAEQKSLSLDNFLDLFKLKDIDFFNLQYGDVTKEIQNFYTKYSLKLEVLNEIDLFNDFLGVASLLKNLDLFITVSNSTAHLAGALNVNTILIKPFNHATLFYWDQKSNKTPWYPSIDLVDGDMVEDKKKFIELVYSKLG